MNFKKTVAIATTVGALTALSIPAMAMENEFNGMYKFMGYYTNFINGAGSPILSKDAESGFMAEQRARLKYTAKASDSLKLVTQFELDSRFGGIKEGYKGTTGNDSGNLDADQLTLETKNIYLETICPLTGATLKIGMQPWSDSYQSLFLNADMTGIHASKKIGAVTGSLAWFRFNDDTAKADPAVGKITSDLIIADAKYAVSKDLTIGGSYYNIKDDQAIITKFERMHMLGLNADVKVGPTSIKPFAAFQFGDINMSAGTEMKGYLLGAVTKTKIGDGAINLSALYLSGDDNAKHEKSFKTVSAGATYFGAANMWLLVRNKDEINSSTSVFNNDMTDGGKGLVGVFGGYEGKMDKVFYNANVGYAQNDKGTAKGIGTEVNAQIGYKISDNLSSSISAAYAVLGDRFDATNADDPYLVNLQWSYTF